MPSANRPRTEYKLAWGMGVKQVKNERKGTLFQIEKAEATCKSFPGEGKLLTHEAALENLAALHRKRYVLEYWVWHIFMDSGQPPVQLSQAEFTFVRQHRTSWPDARGLARADKSTVASAEELRAYLQATILLVDDNTQDPTAASSSQPQWLSAPWVDATWQE